MTSIIEREEDGFVALCSGTRHCQSGDSIEDPRANLIEALTLFFEVADDVELSRRLPRELFVTQVDVPVG